jgi:hypothetical protein
MTSQSEIDAAWAKATPILGRHPDIYRKDAAGNVIYKHGYGKQGSQSWEIDHAKPLAHGSSN